MRFSAFTLLAPFFLVGCYDNNHELNGYKIASPYTGRYYIVSTGDNSRVVIDGNLRQWGTHKHYWYGFTKPYMYSDGFEAPGGYFLLNTEDGSSTESLELYQLTDLLSSFSGLTTETLKFHKTYND